MGPGWVHKPTLRTGRGWGLPGGPGGNESATRWAGRSLETNPEGLEGSKGPPGGPGWVQWPSRRARAGREALQDGWDGLEGPPRGPGGVGRPCRRAGVGRVALPEGWGSQVGKLFQRAGVVRWPSQRSVRGRD